MIFFGVFFGVPLYHLQMWLGQLIEDKGHEPLLARIGFCIFYVFAWIGGFAGAIARPEGTVLHGLIGAFIGCFVVCVMFFGVVLFLPDHRRKGVTYGNRTGREVDDEGLDRFRRAKRRAAREMREHKEQLRREAEERRKPKSERQTEARPPRKEVQALPEVKSEAKPTPPSQRKWREV
jgi:hypothetical protein